MTTLRPHSKTASPIATSTAMGGQSPRQSPKRRRRSRPWLGIRTLVVASFVVPIVAAVGTTGWLSIRNGQRAMLDLATQLRSETTARVEQQLDNYLATPHLINDLNVADLRSGGLNLQNSTALERHLWQQIQLFPSISYIYLGTEQGIFIGAEPVAEGSPNVAYWSQESPNRAYETYATDAQGNRTELLSSFPDYAIFERPWYLAAQNAGSPVWGDVYVWAAPYPEVALPAVRPVYGGAGEFRGVLAVDLSLLAIGDFLKTLEVGKTGHVFIVERDGLMVASSTEDPPFMEANDERVRLLATQSESPLIRGSVTYLTERFGNLSQIEQPQQLTFNLNGEKQLLQVTPYRDEFGLDWLIAVAIPESDFLAQINANTRNTILLCGAALVLATLLGVWTSRWITSPVVRLSKASQAIAQGDLDQQVDGGAIGELGILAESFNQMAYQLRQSFTDLEATKTELENRVENRTAALNEQTQTLQAEVEQLLSIVSEVENGDLTVMAAVSPTVTGLVSDTFNRLIERFGQIMATVSEAASEVNQKTGRVQALALDMADNARQQVESVEQVQALMENINDLSQNNVQQVTAADDAVLATQRAVAQGQQEIVQVNNDIGVLQQEMQQIVGRTQTLSNYTELAVQFVKEQKRIASLTRVLAMNASMLSARASQQQDPTQFAAITHEFEAIATQVNDLAAQTNQSLVLLQQRTEQIQTVVSGLNHDVEMIGQRTDGLTTSVSQSNEAFKQVRVATSQVADLGQQVTQSSQAIATAAQVTLDSVQAISEIAIATSEGANLTTEQSQTMEQVARTLRQSVALFQLPTRAYDALPADDSVADLPNQYKLPPSDPNAENS